MYCLLKLRKDKCKTLFYKVINNNKNILEKYHKRKYQKKKHKVEHVLRNNQLQNSNFNFIAKKRLQTKHIFLKDKNIPQKSLATIG